MAADFWNSTQHRNWLYGSRDALLQARRALESDDTLVQQFPLPETRLLSIFFHQQLLKLAKRSNIRQAPLSTAQVYLRRFYIKVPIRQTNPYLLVSTALYIACKIEESPLSIRVVASEARTLWPEYIGPSDVASVGEAEFRMISTMSCELILHHPHRTVRYLESTFQLSQDETALAWGVVNDSYLTDLALLYPPHVTGWAAVFMALTLRPGQGGAFVNVDFAKVVAAALRDGSELGQSGATGATGSQLRLRRFLDSLAESEVDLAAVSDAVQEIISLYMLWENMFKEKEIRDAISRFVKPRGLAK